MVPFKPENYIVDKKKYLFYPSMTDVNKIRDTLLHPSSLSLH